MRRAGPEDVRIVARLLAEFRAWLGRATPSEDFFAERISELVESEQHEVLVADAVACCVLSFRASAWSRGGGVCCIEDLFVQPQARGAGIGASLVTAAINAATGRRCYRVELDVSRANETAVAFYDGLGFRSRDDDYGADNLVMRLDVAQLNHYPT